MPSGDAADEVVRIYLEVCEATIRLTGAGAKNVAALLLASYQNKGTTKGKTTLNKMLKSNSALKVFTIKKNDLKTFQQQAKRYGVLFTALIDRNNKNYDGMVDILVRADDASKINRIVKRFDLGTINETEIEKEINTSPTLNEKQAKEEVNNKVNNTINDDILDDILSTPKKEVNTLNPNSLGMEKSPPLEHSSNKVMGESVKEKLEVIKVELNTDLKKRELQPNNKNFNSKKNKRKKKKER